MSDHRAPLPTWVDAARVRPGLRVVAGGGARDALLEVATDDLLRVTAARSAPLTNAPDATPDATADATSDATADPATGARSDAASTPFPRSPG